MAGSSEFVVSRREWGRRCCEQKGETGKVCVLGPTRLSNTIFCAFIVWGLFGLRYLSILLKMTAQKPCLLGGEAPFVYCLEGLKKFLCAWK